MLASASPDAYATCLKLLLQDENVNGVLVILPPPPMFKTEEVAEKIIQTLESLTLESDSSLSDKPEASFGTPESKPVVIALMGSTLVEEARKTFQRANIPTYPFPERAASALGALAARISPQSTRRAQRLKKSLVDSVTSVINLGIITAFGIPTTLSNLRGMKTKQSQLQTLSAFLL
jgi:acyl-CoA synthetase (NDP forming)